MTTIPASAFAPNTDTTTVTGAANSLADTFDNFLTLLTTQMQYQDPLSPTDSAEFTNQLVNFANVEQQIAQSSKLDDLIGFEQNRALQTSLGFIGMDVQVTGTEFNHLGGATEFGINLDDNTASTTINVFNERGELVRSLEAPQGKGVHSVAWDGRDFGGNAVAPGTYSINVVALNSEGASLPVSTLVPGRVTGIQTVNGVPELLLGNAVISLDQVVSARQPNDPPPPDQPTPDPETQP